MEKDKLPIKFFFKREIDISKPEAHGSSKDPKWLLSGEELKRHSQILKDKMSSFSEIISHKKSISSTVPFVFNVKIRKEATAKSHMRHVYNLFQTDHINNALGPISLEELSVKIETPDILKTFLSKLADSDRYKYPLSCLDDISAFQASIEKTDNTKAYKIKLIDFQNRSQNKKIQNTFESFLTSNKINFKSTHYTDDLLVYNLKDKDIDFLDSLKSHDILSAISIIEPMPEYDISLDATETTSTLPIKKPLPNRKYTPVGILDSGIARIPHLAPWLASLRQTPYPEDLLNPYHGTAVASIICYGDELESEDWVGGAGVTLFDAAVVPDPEKERISEDELVQNIKEVIDRNHENIKVWNLSLSIRREVENNKFSDLARVTDDLQKKYKVLICKSAGNCTNFSQNLPVGRIHEGADSVLSLVTGSIAHKKSLSDMAEINNPSPFSRKGPAPAEIIKPEVVHYGGNAGINNRGALVQTGVMALTPKGSLISECGTSFSTPRIAALAASIDQELNETFDPLLLKALIVHSATYPKELRLDPSLKTKYLGFGKPKNLKEILYNTQNEITLILRDTLVKGKNIELLDFPMPACLVEDGFFSGQISATLAYEPELDGSQGPEYCQSNIDLKLGTYDSKITRDTAKKGVRNELGKTGGQNLLNADCYAKLPKNNDGEPIIGERLLKKYGKFCPVKKYTVDLRGLKIKYKKEINANRLWYLKLEGLYRDNAERKSITTERTLSQDFCLIITIKDLSKRKNVYDAVTQKLRDHNFHNVNIKLTNDLQISI